MTFFIAFFPRYLCRILHSDRPDMASAGLVGRRRIDWRRIIAVNVLPAVVLRSETVRGTFSYAQSVNYSLPWLD